MLSKLAPDPPKIPSLQAGLSAQVMGVAAFGWLVGCLSIGALMAWGEDRAWQRAAALILASGLISLTAAWLVARRLKKLPPPVILPPAQEPPRMAEHAGGIIPLKADPELLAPLTNLPSADLLAALSREFRTPLNGILGMSGFLLEEDLNPDSRHFSRSIEQSAEALLTIVNDILDFAKLEASQLELEPIIFNPRHTVEDVLASVSQRAEAKRLDLTALFNARIPDWVEGDPGALRQVLLYLLGNAIEFTERGGVQVRVGLDPDGQLQFEVRDTGIGMSAAVLARLFSPHSQADHAASRRPAGSGLGLAISYGLLNLMGGAIQVESRVGEGSRFWFTAGLKPCSSPGPGPDATAPPLGATPGRGTPKVLLAGPSTGSLHTLETHLKELGLDLRRCGGAETLDAGTVRGFDLLVLAPEGPDLSALLARARNLREAHAPPMVLFSTFVQRGQARLAHKVGFAGFLCRPLQLSFVEAVVTGVLQGHPFLITRHQFEERNAADHRPVLVMEAREEAQLQIVRLLQHSEWKPYWTRDGQGALEAVQQRVYDFVLMDCSQPDRGGIEATRLLRAGGIKVPIIGLLAHTTDGDNPDIMTAGLNATLTKPLRPADLTAIMERFRPRR